MEELFVTLVESICEEEKKNTNSNFMAYCNAIDTVKKVFDIDEDLASGIVTSVWKFSEEDIKNVSKDGAFEMACKQFLGDSAYDTIVGIAR